MSTEASEQMMRLLEELAVLKKIDSESSSGAGAADQQTSGQERQKRRDEISEEIQKLAEESKEAPNN
jgi:hypothetical protein